MIWITRRLFLNEKDEFLSNLVEGTVSFQKIIYTQNITSNYSYITNISYDIHMTLPCVLMNLTVNLYLHAPFNPYSFLLATYYISEKKKTL